MKPKLYQYQACPFCTKVRTMLQYKDVDFEIIEVHPLKKTEIEFSTDYKAVPIYVDSNGKQVNDSTDIMRAIDTEYPQKKVFSDNAEAASREEKWLAWSEKLVKGLPTAIYDSLPHALQSFNYIMDVGKFNWWEKRTIKYSGAFVMTLVAKKIKKREEITDPAAFCRNKSAEWVEGLGGNKFMGGDQPGAADIAVFGFVKSVSNLAAGKYFFENAVFHNWYRAVEELLNIKTSQSVS